MEKTPSADRWLKEAKSDPKAEKCGMFLVHNGTVRADAKAKVRFGENENRTVSAMDFSYDKAKIQTAVEKTYAMPGIYYVRTWLNSGRLSCGDDIMLVLVGGDIRPHVIAALESLVDEIKNNCVIEKEIFEN